MTDTTREPPSVVERTRPVAVTGPVVSAHFLGDRAAFVLGEEAVVLAASDGATSLVNVHAGGILASAGDGERIVTGGDDGKVAIIAASGEVTAKASRIVHAAKPTWMKRRLRTSPSIVGQTSLNCRQSSIG